MWSLVLRSPAILLQVFVNIFGGIWSYLGQDLEVRGPSRRALMEILNRWLGSTGNGHLQPPVHEPLHSVRQGWEGGVCLAGDTHSVTSTSTSNHAKPRLMPEASRSRPKVPGKKYPGALTG